ncbi:hypothetical protein JD844_004278 [Phrynosoma platyrhinos]|uniref:Myotubularin phosphatase domain-containing protein n=1 Tax=Phrynosoma platyrhinos TaxID=52577 RepID=A0ABQ7TNA9_PHRPL|nr:hypothetical protein JD844_004278 [Phrynosoma platyrhinos]
MLGVEVPAGARRGVGPSLRRAVENVKLLDRYTNRKTANGTLYLTATHLIYVNASAEILHHHIAAVEKLPLTASGCPLLIHCKNFRVAHFVIGQERDCHEVYTSLLKLSQPVKPEELYAFSYNPKMPKDNREAGWNLIDVKVDYQRMGIPNDYWEITDFNKDYEVCNTYSPDLVVPKAATRAMVVGSSKFRSRGRIPVLSYFYKENNAAICRCSQPLSGFNARCLEDEQLLQAIREANPGSQFMYVVDTRPKLNAMANRAAGKGYENVDNYDNIRFKFIGIENIHVMRSSLQKLLEVCETKSPSMSDFLTGLENSGWLRHIKAVMDAGVFLAKAVKDEKASVLVHCSDGWDRTAQVLIEKEWISMGHKFSHRCGHLEGDPKEVSPVFTQFIECTWQLMQQFPCAFDFNDRFLLEIHDHIYSIFEKTHSLWPFLLQKKQEFRNPLYKGFTAYQELWPNTFPYSFHSLLVGKEEEGRKKRKLPLTDSLPLPEEISILSKMTTASTSSSKSPMLNTPQDYESEEVPALLANGSIAGKESEGPDHQLKSKESLVNPHDIPEGVGVTTNRTVQLDAEAQNLQSH